MDSGRPFRITRPDDGRGRTPVRPATTSRQPEAARSNEKPSAPTASATTAEPIETAAPEKTKARPVKPKRLMKKLRTTLLTLGLVILVGVGVFFAWPVLSGGSKLPGANEYQAVTLVDGQIYFGKVQTVGNEYVKIENGYYLQPSASQSSEGGQPDTGKLVRLSNRLYSPSGSIVIPISQVISFEPLDPDGQIVQMMGNE